MIRCLYLKQLMNELCMGIGLPMMEDICVRLIRLQVGIIQLLTYNLFVGVST